jgi:two-component system CheB/CheR fusion protein
MVLVEALEQQPSPPSIQIFGTDISDLALEKARAGIFTDTAVAEIAPERIRRFFSRVDGGHQINKSIREMCVFARQDLAKDPPFSRLDIVSCRNVMIYMGPVLQKKIMAIFHYALRPSGILILGKSETISGYSDLFTPVGKKHKIYAKKLSVSNAVFQLSPATEPETAAPEESRPEAPPKFASRRKPIAWW